MACKLNYGVLYSMFAPSLFFTKGANTFKENGKLVLVMPRSWMTEETGSIPQICI